MTTAWNTIGGLSITGGRDSPVLSIAYKEAKGRPCEYRLECQIQQTRADFPAFCELGVVFAFSKRCLRRLPFAICRRWVGGWVGLTSLSTTCSEDLRFPAYTALSTKRSNRDGGLPNGALIAACYCDEYEGHLAVSSRSTDCMHIPSIYTVRIVPMPNGEQINIGCMLARKSYYRSTSLK